MNLDDLGGPYKTVFDVGGNQGDFAEACWRKWPGAAIHSFEPIPDLATANKNRGGLNWWVHTFALLDVEPGPVVINRNLRQSGASSILTPGPIRREAFGAIDEVYDRERVQSHQLDYFIPDIMAPALLKIDVEGAELRVLNGGKKALPLFDTVVVEINASPDCFIGAPTGAEIREVLERHGFKYEGSVDELRDPRNGEVVQFDALYRR